MLISTYAFRIKLADGIGAAEMYLQDERHIYWSYSYVNFSENNIPTQQKLQNTEPDVAASKLSRFY